jgi:hypothetical protein
MIDDTPAQISSVAMAIQCNTCTPVSGRKGHEDPSSGANSCDSILSESNSFADICRHLQDK